MRHALPLFICPLFALLATPTAVRADAVQVYYLNAGVQSSSDSTSVETFNNSSIVNGTLTTTFNGSGITGTYSGGFQLNGANVYGGAGNTGQFIQPTLNGVNGGGSFTLTLSQSVNYFGLWFSALDAGNQLAFYNGSNLVYSFGAQDFIGGVGSCPTSAYCGNPNYTAPLNDPAEQFAFINFYDFNGSFNKIVFSEATNSGSANFESDNHTFANLASSPKGTPLNAVPEPSCLTLVLSGAGALSLWRRPRSR